jgi:hypothetical protein
MSKRIDIGFKLDRLEIAIENICPIKTIPDRIKKTKKYNQIAASVAEIGLVEPLIVHPQKGAKGKFLLLDGHMLLDVLKSLGARTASCLVSRDDESFTYNKRINRLSTVQEHYMILKAIERGVSEDRIAKALDVNVARIQQKRKLLDGICPEAVEALKDRHFATSVANILKRMKPLRQIETVELMIAVNNFSISYAKALLLATPEDQLRDPGKKKPVKGISEEEMQRMEREMENLRRDMKAVEKDYGTNVVRLVVANGYVARLLENDQVASYIERNHGELMNQLQNITQMLAEESGLQPGT